MKIILTESQFKRVIIKEEDTFFFPNIDCKKLDKRKSKTIPVEANAYDIQRFLKELGYDIGTTGKNKDGVDGDFKDKSAKAFASFYKKISFNLMDFNFFISPTNTLDGLYKQLKSYGHNVGERTGFGPKMAKVLSEIASKYIKNSFTKENCRMEIMRKKISKELEEVEKSAIKTLEYCKKNKSKILEEIKQLWYDWANSTVTKRKLKKNILDNAKAGNYLMIDTPQPPIAVYKKPDLFVKIMVMSVKKAVKNFSANNIKCLLEEEDSELKDANALQRGDKMLINCSSKEMGNPISFKNTLLHEFTHFIEGKVDYINLHRDWERPLPLVKQGFKTNVKRAKSPTVTKLKNIETSNYGEILNQNVIKDFKNYGISEDDLSRWLSNVKYWGEDYDCRQTEKEANLKSLKLHFCNNLTCDLTIDHLKKIIRGEVKDVTTNALYLMKCWASNGFQPNFKQFLNGLNSLALNNGMKNNDGLTYDQKT